MKDTALEDSIMICPAKRCKRYQVPILTDGKYCSVCGAKLKKHLGSGGPVMTDLSNHPSNKPAGFKISELKPDDMVERKHYTAYNSGKQIWECWCGATMTDGRMAQDHDKLPLALVKYSEIPGGVSFWVPKETTSRYKSASTAEPPKDDTFQCEPDVDGCPLIKAAGMKPRIEVPDEMFRKWIHLARKFKTEWLAFLIGEKIEPCEQAPMGGWAITDMYFPKQVVTPAHVTVDEEELRNMRPGVIGDVHSHVDMAAFFSGEDIKHFNYDVHLVINSKGDLDSSIRAKLECHRTTRLKGSVWLIGTEDQAQLEEELKLVLREPPKPLVVESGNSSSGFAGGRTNGTSGQTNHSYGNGSTHILSGPRSGDTWSAD